MIFTPEHVQMIISGAKTQTRRIVKPGERAMQVASGTPLEFMTPGERWGDIMGVRTATGRTKWRVGNTYAAQPGRGKMSVARIRVTGIRRGRLIDISEDDVEAEGCGLRSWGYDWPKTAAFAELWDSINTSKNTQWEDNPDVWVLDFEAVK